MDVAVKGLFWLLETCRSSQTFQQFILIGGDAGVGHFVYPHPIPVTETQRHSAYPGCYALSKVLEEVMLEQYYIQYNLVNAILLALDHWAARQHTFNICMDEPVDYGEVGAYLAASRGLTSVEIKTPYPSTWLDNTKAKFLLGWRPGYDLQKMIDAAWEYRRAEDDPRFTWYPG